MKHSSLSPVYRLSVFLLLAISLGLYVAPGTFLAPVAAQTETGDEADSEATPSASETPTDGEDVPETTQPPKKAKGLSLFWLLSRGGWLMIPIYLLSIVVVTFAIERALALRQSKVLPGELIDELGRMAASEEGFDPKTVYKACRNYPSTAAAVVRSMLLKIGRPLPEVEHAAAEASEREAARLYNNVRWLTLSAAIAPLMGLFGTVWGIMRAFYDMTDLAPGVNKADALATGIYEALVTTLGGLAIAIPAAILAHYFEGRIQSVFLQVDELTSSLLPQLERYEGRLRVDVANFDTKTGAQTPPPPPPKQVKKK